MQETVICFRSLVKWAVAFFICSSYICSLYCIPWMGPCFCSGGHTVFEIKCLETACFRRGYVTKRSFYYVLDFPWMCSWSFPHHFCNSNPAYLDIPFCARFHIWNFLLFNIILAIDLQCLLLFPLNYWTDLWEVSSYILIKASILVYEKHLGYAMQYCFR